MMSANSLANQAGSPASGLLPATGRTVLRLAALLLRYGRHRQARAQLAALDDAALKDMGLTRSQITAAVTGRLDDPRCNRLVS